MTIGVGSNIASLKTQRSLAKAGDQLGQSLERLASGQRINRATDDAAGLAVSASLSSKSRVFNQANRNISDGISALNIAHGSLEQLTQMAIRLEQLAEQAANGVYSSEQRKALDNEVKALVAESERIVSTTTFNGKQLLTSGSEFRLQVGANGSEESTLLARTSGPLVAKGDGTFGGVTTYGGGNDMRAIQTADLNKDGDQDVVSISGAAGTVIAYANNGQGGLSSVAYGGGGDVSDVEIGDINGDGNLDLASVSLSGILAVFQGNGDGSFSAALTASLQGRSLDLGDVNGDNILDIVSAGLGSGYVSIGNGDGTFSTTHTFSGVGPNASVADINRDGRNDIIFAGGSGGIVTMLGNGDGSFQSPSTYTFGNTISDQQLVDVNGDGVLDVVGTDTYLDSVFIALGQSDGTFSSATSYAGLTGGSYSFTAGDFNGDSTVDLIVASGSNSYALRFDGTGGGAFAAAVTINSGSFDRISSTDLDGDGVLDVVGAKSAPVNALKVNLGNSRLASLGVTVPTLSVLSQESSRSALDTLSVYRSQISSIIGDIGGTLSRLEVASNYVSTQRDEYSTANSRIVDTDIAKESAALTASSILQQVGSAVLAQANVQPSLALRLIQG